MDEPLLSDDEELERERRRIGLSMAAALRVLGYQLHSGDHDSATKMMYGIADLAEQLFVAENPDAGPSAAERADAVQAAAEAVQAGELH